MGFWRRIFGGRDRAAGIRDDEDIAALHAEFCRTFCHRPGVNFVDAPRADGVSRLIDWLRPTHPCPLSKGFVRLAVDATRRGVRVWEQPGLTMTHEGSWDGGGLPSQESQDALSVLAQVLGKPIRLCYRPRPDAEWLVKEFPPGSDEGGGAT